MKKWLVWLSKQSEFRFDINLYEWAVPLYIDFESVCGYYFGIKVLCFKFIWQGTR